MAGPVAKVFQSILGYVPYLKQYADASPVAEIPRPLIMHQETAGTPEVSLPKPKTLGTESIAQIVKEHKSAAFEHYPEALRDIQSKIIKTGTDEQSMVDFKPSLLTTEARKLMNTLVALFQQKLIILNNANTLDAKTYIDLYNLFYRQAHDLILDVNNAVLQKTLELHHCNDLDIAKALVVSRDLSKQLARVALESIRDSYKVLPQIPITTEANQVVDLRAVIDKSSRTYLRNLYLASKFGMHSKSVIESFKAATKVLPKGSDQSLHFTLQVLSNLQNATQGAVLLNYEHGKLKSSEAHLFDPAITHDVTQALITNTIENFQLCNDERLTLEKLESTNITNFNDRNLRKFLSDANVVEVNMLEAISKLGTDPLLQQLGLNPEDEADNCAQIYGVQDLSSRESSVSQLLGTLSDDSILGSKPPSRKLVDLMGSDNHSQKQFRRLIVEVSLAAAMDVVVNQRYGTKYQSTMSKDFETIPWMADLYKERKAFYQSMIRTNTQELSTAEIILEMSKLGKELHQIGLFAVEDFFERYQMQESGGKLLDMVSDLTDVGVAALMLDLFSNLFSYLQHEEGSSLAPITVDRLKTLIRYLKNELTVYDDQGRRLIAPKRPNDFAVKVYNKMHTLMADGVELKLDSELIIDFLEDSLGLVSRRGGMVHGNATTKAKHVNLASLLFYNLIKFAPERSNDMPSLEARIDILKVLIRQDLQQYQKVPGVLYKKWELQALGQSEHGNFPSTNGRQGIIKSLCDDLDSKVDDYIHGRPCPIPLAELIGAYARVEKIFADNPTARDKATLKINELHKTPAKPLLRGLANVLNDLSKVDSTLVVDFVRSRHDANLMTRLKQNLLTDLGKSAGDILGKHHDPKTSVLVINDNDQEAITSLTKFLEKAQDLAEAVKPAGSSETIPVMLDIFMQGQSKTEQVAIQKYFQAFKQVLTSSVILRLETGIRNDVEAFPGQYEAKNRLLYLLNQFKSMPPYLGIKHTWLNDKAIQKQLANKNTAKPVLVLS